VLAPSGQLDLISAAEVEAVLRRVCIEEDVRAVTLDLSAVTFMDSTGLHAVLSARELCRAQGCEFALIPGSAQVQRLFELCGLLDSLPFRARGPAGRKEAARPAAADARGRLAERRLLPRDVAPTSDRRS